MFFRRNKNTRLYRSTLEAAFAVALAEDSDCTLRTLVRCWTLPDDTTAQRVGHDLRIRLERAGLKEHVLVDGTRLKLISDRDFYTFKRRIFI